MKDFISTHHCISRAHCNECRHNSRWRADLRAPEVCPHGVTHESIQKHAPSLPQQAASLGKALVNWTTSGFAATPPDILAAREATCKACPEWDAAAMGGTARCRKCGCSTWAKIRMATERCPLSKWDALRPAPSAVI